MVGQNGRQLAAVMFADMVGFTALMQEDEQSALQSRDRYRSVIERLHVEFEGRIVQYYGDGTLSIFSNSVDAVRCAVAIQKTLSEEPSVPVRVGLHVGDVVVEEHGLLGDAVNVASRIESFGQPGAVLVSDSVHDQVKNQPSLEFVSLGEFNLENVVRRFEVFAIDAEGLTIPAVDSLAGKGRRAIGRSAPVFSGRLWRLAIASIAVMAIVAGVVFMIRSDPLLDESIVPTVPTSFPVETTGPSDDSAVLWEARNDEPARLLSVAGGVVISGRQEAGGFVLEGLAAASGDRLWERQMGTVYSLHPREDSVIVVHRVELIDRVDLLDPTTGEPISGCGFVLPTGLTSPGDDVFTRFVVHAQTEAGASISSIGSDTYVLLGVGTPGESSADSNSGLIRLTSNPAAPSCHTNPTYQENVTRWPPILSGPVVAGESVYVGDSGTLQAYTVDGLAKEWDTFPAIGQVAGYDGSVRQIAAREVRLQYADGIRTETLLYAVDGESALHRVVDGALVASVGTSGAPIVVTDHWVIFVDPDDKLTAIDHDLVDIGWTLQLASPTVGPILIGDKVVIGTDRIQAFDEMSGDLLLSHTVSERIVTIALAAGMIVVSDDAGGITTIAIPGESIQSPISLGIQATPTDPLDVTREFFDAMQSGDRVQLSRLIGIDLHIPEQYTAAVVAPWAMHWWIDPDTQDRFWTRIELFDALNSQIQLGECETGERRDGDGVEVVCNVTHRDDFHDIFGVEFKGTTHIVVRDGLVRMLFSGEFDSREYADDRPAGHYYRMKVGEFRGMDLGINTGAWFEPAWEWAQEVYPDEFSASCSADTPKTATSGCAEFLLDIAPEFATARNP